jgi:hypothetical protein
MRGYNLFQFYENTFAAHGYDTRWQGGRYRVTAASTGIARATTVIKILWQEGVRAIGFAPGRHSDDEEKRAAFYRNAALMFQHGVVPSRPEKLGLLAEHVAIELETETARLRDTGIMERLLPASADAMIDLLMTRLVSQAQTVDDALEAGRVPPFCPISDRTYNSLCHQLEESEPGSLIERKLCQILVHLMDADDAFSHGEAHDALVERLSAHIRRTAPQDPLFDLGFIALTADILADNITANTRLIGPSYIALLTDLLALNKRPNPRHIADLLYSRRCLTPGEELLRTEIRAFNHDLARQQEKAAQSLSGIVRMVDAERTPRTCHELFNEASLQKLATAQSAKHLTIAARVDIELARKDALFLRQSRPPYSRPITEESKNGSGKSQPAAEIGRRQPARPIALPPFADGNLIRTFLTAPK